MARDEQKFDVWLRDLQTLNSVAGQEETLFTLDHPDYPFEQKKALVDRLAGASVRPQALHVLYYLVQKGRAHQLPLVLRQFQGLVNTERNIRVAEVVTATPLPADQAEALSENLGRRYGGTVSLEQRVDPSIIGGVVVRVGDLLLDGSVHGRLQSLREQLMRTVR